MTAPTITPLPAAPSRQSPDTFADRSDALVAALPALVTETNTLGTFINNAAVSTAADAVTASAASTTAAGAANFAGAWSGLTGALNVPASVSHTDTVWLLTVNLADVTASEPASGNTDWLDVGGVQNNDPVQLNLNSFADAIVTLTGTTPDVNLEAAGEYRLTTSGDTTFTVSNPPANGYTTLKTLIVTAGGTHTLTFWAGILTVADAVPTAPASGVTMRYQIIASTVSGTTTYALIESGIFA